MELAWIVAVDMGYGHQRAAQPLSGIACERILTANTDAMVPEPERRHWAKLQGGYEGISRLSRVPVVGPYIWRAYDALQAIHPHYPIRDLSAPTIGVLRLARMLDRGFARSIVDYTRKREDLPLLTTFFAVALAADEARRRDVFCVVTDSDVNRIWVAKDPRRSRVQYLAPFPLTRMRLLQYGVPEENIFVTGFPLPEENVATAAADTARRIVALDRRGTFLRKYGPALPAVLGPLPEDGERPLSVTYAVGGAGAQADVAGDILASLARRIREGSLRLNLVAGVREEVARYFREAVTARGLEPEIGRGIHILLEPDKPRYFESFNRLLRETDVLWTKPSELCFFGALGIPLIFSPALGAHEERNLDAVIRAGAGQRQEEPRAAAEWLQDWTGNGLLAFNAFNGYFHMPRGGTENIKRLLAVADRSKVELDMWPPASSLSRKAR